jgi:hypothetical protein
MKGMVHLILSGLALTGALGAAGSRPYFEVSAAFEPASRPGGDAAIVVSLAPLDPGVHVNERPEPRLALEPEQRVLVDKQQPPAARAATFDPDNARYLDPARPVRFAVAVAPTAPKGRQVVRAWVTYFYCSQTESWCRRGKDEVEVVVVVR